MKLKLEYILIIENIGFNNRVIYSDTIELKNYPDDSFILSSMMDFKKRLDVISIENIKLNIKSRVEKNYILESQP